MPLNTMTDGVDTSTRQLTELVLTYGTLKKGYGNASRILEGNAEYVGPAVTVRTDLIMEGYGVPMVYKKSDILEAYPHSRGEELDEYYGQVKGDLWRVSWMTLSGPLDALEGHPTGYTRQQTQVWTEDGRDVTAWFYFVLNGQWFTGQHIVPKNSYGEYEWKSA